MSLSRANAARCVASNRLAAYDDPRPDDWDLGYEEALDNVAHALAEYLFDGEPALLSTGRRPLRDQFLKDCGVAAT